MPSRYGRRQGVGIESDDPNVVSQGRALTPLECIQQAAKLVLTEPESLQDEESWFIARLTEWQQDMESKAAKWAVARFTEILEELISNGQFVGAIPLAGDRIINEIAQRYNQGAD